MHKHFFLACWGAMGLCTPLLGNAGVDSDRAERVNDFVQKHLELARVERDQFRIPVSITLAQAILESNLGASKLAVSGNNFFGIKCHDWQGDTLLQKDDDHNKDGILVESCFRSYGSAAESFRDHSEFLQKDRYQKRFAGLSSDDYAGWANALQAAGYATDPLYAKKLVQLIEANGLAQYDTAGDAESTSEGFVGPPPPPPAPPRQRVLMISMRPEFASFALR